MSIVLSDYMINDYNKYHTLLLFKVLKYYFEYLYGVDELLDFINRLNVFSLNNENIEIDSKELKDIFGIESLKVTFLYKNNTINIFCNVYVNTLYINSVVNNIKYDFLDDYCLNNHDYKINIIITNVDVISVCNNVDCYYIDIPNVIYSNKLEFNQTEVIYIKPKDDIVTFNHLPAILKMDNKVIKVDSSFLSPFHFLYLMQHGAVLNVDKVSILFSKNIYDPYLFYRILEYKPCKMEVYLDLSNYNKLDSLKGALKEYLYLITSYKLNLSGISLYFIIYDFLIIEWDSLFSMFKHYFDEVYFVKY